MFSTTEGTVVLIVSAVVVIWLLLLAHQAYRSRQFTLRHLVAVDVTIGALFVVVGGLFLVYSRPAAEPLPARRLPPGPPAQPVLNTQPEPEPTLPKGYVCYRCDTPPVVDGALTDPAWQLAPWTDFFVDIEGEFRPAPRFTTRAKLLWDSHALYIGATLQEPHVWAALTDPLQPVFRDNDFEVYLDPDGDNHNYYELGLNALATRCETTLAKPHKDGGPALRGTGIAGLQLAVRVSGTLNNPEDADGGWSIEIVLPWAGFARYHALNLPPEHGDLWRMNLGRVEWRHMVVNGAYRQVPDAAEENWVWSPQGVVNMHRPETWGYLQFSTAPAGADTFVRDPTQAARELLMGVYYAQRGFQERNQRWAPSLEALTPPPPVQKGNAQLTNLQAAGTGYVATALCRLPDGSERLLHTDQTSRLWTE